MNAVVAPLNTLNTTTHQLRPATPSELIGDCSKGCAFLSSCDLYIGLAPTHFTNDQARIYWVLSFMKGDHIVHFTDQTMQLAQQMGSLPWATWAEFQLEFIPVLYCPPGSPYGLHMDCSKVHMESKQSMQTPSK